MSKTFDLTTLNLSAGTHEITVKARAKDYTASADSNKVNYDIEVPPTSGLTYSLSSNGAEYTCSGRGTATGASIAIANEINGIPVTTIGSDAFADDEVLTEIYIPKNVKYVHATALKKCKSLVNITVDSRNTRYYTIDGNLYSNYENIVSLCKYAAGKTNASFVIPDGVVYINDYAFYQCRNLTSITIPNGVVDIGRYAFCGIQGLTNVVIPDSVTTIWDEAFAHCGLLTSLVIGNSVTTILDKAFAHCGGYLKSVTIPKSVIHMYSNVFKQTGIDKLRIYCEVSRKPSGWWDKWNYETFYNGKDEYHPVTWGNYDLIRDFTIDEVTYQYVDGMTWGEWVDSDYNTLGLIKYPCEDDDDSYIGKEYDGVVKYVKDTYNERQFGSDEIKNRNYFITTSPDFSGGGTN